MKNKFVVTACRFHAKEKDQLVITGWFWKNDIEDNKIVIVLDNKKLSYKMKEQDLLLREVKNKDGQLITKQYYLWINLPKDWKQYQKLRVVNCYGRKQEMTCVVPVEKLLRMEKKIPKYVDKGNTNEEGFSISGWYINTENVKLGFYGLDGRSYPVTVKRVNRTDVLRFYPEVTEDEVVGFVASYQGKVPKKIKVQFKSDTKKVSYTMPMHMSALGKKGAQLKAVYEKAKVYYLQFGTISTIKRIARKITKKESITNREWYRAQCLTKSALAAQAKRKFPYMPKISIVVPLYKTPENYLHEMIQSVKNQTYANWELCLSDGSGADSPIRAILEEYMQDKRIKVVSHDTPLQISENTNAALDIATGDYIAFADHDDLLAPSALYECVEALNKDRSVEIIYTDEDKVDMKGKEHFMPHFKSDFNIDMLCCTNYICHLFVVKREIYEKAGKLNSEFDGAQDYDFVLRCVEQSNKIKHIPKVLYHWRAHKDSTAENPESKRYAFEAGARAVKAHFDRIGIHADVEMTDYNGIYRPKYILEEHPLVSVIIANKDHTEDLEKCIRSLEEKNRYQEIEYIIVENNSTDKKTFAYYEELQKKCPKAKVITWDQKGFNYPLINNFGAEHAKGEYLLFLNNDTEVLNEDCIEELLGYCMRSDVGAVGARLYYEDNTIQHAGVVVGMGGIAGHAFLGFEKGDPGYFGRIIMAQDYSAVTAACMMVKRQVFEEVGGFDEKLAVAFNDIDLCLKIRRAGYLIVYNPYAELKHYESKSRGREDTEEKVQRFNAEMYLFAKRWADFIEEGDPFYSPNLTLDRNDFSLNVQVNKIGKK
nr:glycosyltransferase family 2 protein [uncultured Faecalicatena sp.]